MKSKLTITIGSDHAGFELKEKLIDHIKHIDHLVLDVGCTSNERADYPDFGHAVAMELINKNADFGILICGSGNGIAMSANKHAGIRAAICWNNELAALARQHNDANVLVLPARFISEDEAKKCLDKFLTEKFEGGRHEARLKKIDIN